MIKQKVLDILNQQIAKELYSANLYLSMAAYFHSINMKGFANWMTVQFEEEMAHSMKFFDYIISRGGKAVLAKIDAPPNHWKNSIEVFEEALKHEEKVTEYINNIADLALKEKDHATSAFLQWFITEQVEEEANVTDIVERLKLAGDSKGGLFLMDNELKVRVFTPPPPNNAN